MSSGDSQAEHQAYYDIYEAAGPYVCPGTYRDGIDMMGELAILPLRDGIRAKLHELSGRDIDDRTLSFLSALAICDLMEDRRLDRAMANMEEPYELLDNNEDPNDKIT